MKSFSKSVTDAKVMASGIRANRNVLVKRGIDEAYADELDRIADDVLQLNNEQEILKAKLREKTEALNTRIDELNLKNGSASKIVKIDFPKSAWKEFGVTAKK
jgi:hypothetical protein